MWYVTDCWSKVFGGRHDLLANLFEYNQVVPKKQCIFEHLETPPKPHYSSLSPVEEPGTTSYCLMLFKYGKSLCFLLADSGLSANKQSDYVCLRLHLNTTVQSLRATRKAVLKPFWPKSLPLKKQTIVDLLTYYWSDIAAPSEELFTLPTLLTRLRFHPSVILVIY